MKFKFLTGILMLFALLLAACAPKPASAENSSNNAAANSATVSTMDPNMGGMAMPTSTAQVDSGESLTRSDAQGSVTVEVTPESLSPTGDTFVFDVGMNTHMVDLGMDLAKLSTLSTDDGRTVQATTWDAPEGGGHHVSGKLTFPAKQDGKSLLDGATRLTLTIQNVDVGTRLFTWQLAK